MSTNIRNAVLAWPLLFGLCCSAAPAQTRADLLRCRAIADDPARLACYDALPLFRAAPAGKYQAIPLTDLSEAPLSYRGRLVEVIGQIAATDGGYVLSPGGQNGRDLPLEVDALPREQRERLQQSCAAGCEATVQGRVAPVQFVTGIVADAVLLR